MAYQFHHEKHGKDIITRLVQYVDGKRVRPVMGRNLTPTEDVEKADAYVRGMIPAPVELTGASTLGEMKELYLKHMQLEERVDPGRGLGVLRNHLDRLFPQPMKDLTLMHGMDYIIARRKEGASNGTIERECGVLMRLLNLAVVHKYLIVNPLTSLKVPVYGERDRPATMEELHAIRDVCVPDVWRAVLVGLCTGLREGRIMSICAEQIAQDTLSLPESGTAKANIKIMPLNRTALAALRGATPAVAGPVFPWKTANAFGKIWRRTVRKASRQCPSLATDPLKYHDLRHTFATALQDLDVDITVVSFLLGHSQKRVLDKHIGSTAKYTHGWERKARLAVDLLDAHWAPLHNTLSLATAHNLPILPISENRANA